MGESVAQPLRYYDCNVTGSLRLLEAMDRAGVRRLIYSSTCATYGNAEEMPITEQTPTVPVNPYAHRQLEIVLLLCALLTAAGRVGTVRPSSLRRM